jgi:hypothetical protein
VRSIEPGESWVWCYVDEIVPGEVQTHADLLRRTELRSRTRHLTLFIHFRIGRVTLSSAVLGDMTSEIWP